MRRRGQPPAGDLFGEDPIVRSSDRPPDRLPARPSDRPSFSVSELAFALKTATEQAVGQVWIKGEVIGLKVTGPGHWYFTLGDEAAQLRCVMWRTYAQRLRTAPPEGAEVYLLGTPTVWAQKGDLRVSAVTMLPTAGVGLQQLSFERTRERLEKDGLLDPARKRPRPAFPRTIAIITSADGAVLHDIRTVIRRRWPATRLVVVAARVQGEDAALELVRAIETVDRLDQVELCIVARGGGAREDLLVFNAEAVCRAVAAIRVPTISAVGHETDVTLTDLVADLRAATPSAAAELAVPDRADVARHLASLANRLGVGLRRRTEVLAERIGRLSERMEHTVRGRVERRRRDWDRLAASLDALSPLAVLSRGYSVARLDDGAVVKRRAQIPAGTPFRLRLSDGSVGARSE